jgi:hypothetical protein
MRTTKNRLKELGLKNQYNATVFVENFIDYLPKRLDHAVENELDTVTTDCYNKLDYIDFHYRRYLAGVYKTLHRVFFEVRRFIRAGHSPEHVIKLLSDIKELALKLEFYELMLRLEKSTTSIKKTLTSDKLL